MIFKIWINYLFTSIVSNKQLININILFLFKFWSSTSNRSRLGSFDSNSIPETFPSSSSSLHDGLFALSWCNSFLHLKKKLQNLGPCIKYGSLIIKNHAFLAYFILLQNFVFTIIFIYPIFELNKILFTPNYHEEGFKFFNIIFLKFFSFFVL